MSEAVKQTGVKLVENVVRAPSSRFEEDKPSFRTKVKNHCRRFWWVYLLILVVVVLVITLPIILVAYPRMAQDGVNKSVITVSDMSILNSKPSSFDLDLTSILTTHSEFHPKLDAWDGSLYLADSDTAFAKVKVPATKANNGTKIHIRQTVQILSMGQYTEFVKTALATDEYYLMLRGRGGLKEGGLPKMHADYNKNITMKGFKGLEGFNITEFQILPATLPDGSNMNGTASVPNPTVMTVAMGNVTLALSVAGVPIGTSVLPDLILRPGTNLIPMYADTNESVVIGMLQQLQFSSGILPVDIVGNKSIYNHQGLQYIETALQGTKLTADLNIGQVLQEAGLGNLSGGVGNSTT